MKRRDPSIVGGASAVGGPANINGSSPGARRPTISKSGSKANVMTPTDAPPRKPTNVVIWSAVIAISALLLWKLAGVLLLLFSAVVFAAALSAIGDALRKLAPIPRQLAVLVSAGLIFGILAAIIALFGWRIVAQYEEIIGKVRESVHMLMVFTRSQGWGQALIERANGAKVSDATDTLAPLLGSLLTGTARYATYGAIVVAGSIFLALSPGRYRDGVLILVPPAQRAIVSDFLTRSGVILKRWLLSRLIVMVALGVLVSIGLKVLGIDGAITLGLTGGLLTFIPFIGALMAAIPAVLVALTVSPQIAILTAFMFWGAHFIEGTFITPLVQDESVDLPPVLTIFSTLAFTVVFGPSGVLLASPLVLVIITAIQVFYLEGHLGHPPPEPRRRALPWSRRRPAIQPPLGG
jgi:predicted PurR-regulated permease PerM